jgi:hypothetical protein
MKHAIVLLFAMILAACGNSKLEGTYSNNMTGVAEQKFAFTFRPDGTARMSIGSTTIPLELPYEISGNKVKVAGQQGVTVLTMLDNGDLLMDGIRLTKETATSRAAPPAIADKAPEPQKTQEKDIRFCRELAAKARAAKPGEFAGDPEFLPNVSHCYKLAKEAGEELVWTSAEPSKPKQSSQ